MLDKNAFLFEAEFTNLLGLPILLDQKMIWKTNFEKKLFLMTLGKFWIFLCFINIMLN